MNGYLLLDALRGTHIHSEAFVPFFGYPNPTADSKSARSAFSISFGALLFSVFMNAKQLDEDAAATDRNRTSNNNNKNATSNSTEESSNSTSSICGSSSNELLISFHSEDAALYFATHPDVALLAVVVLQRSSFDDFGRDLVRQLCLQFGDAFRGDMCGRGAGSGVVKKYRRAFSPMFTSLLSAATREHILLRMIRNGCGGGQDGDNASRVPYVCVCYAPSPAEHTSVSLPEDGPRDPALAQFVEWSNLSRILYAAPKSREIGMTVCNHTYKVFAVQPVAGDDLVVVVAVRTGGGGDPAAAVRSAIGRSVAELALGTMRSLHHSSTKVGATANPTLPPPNPTVSPAS